VVRRTTHPSSTPPPVILLAEPDPPLDYIRVGYHRCSSLTVLKAALCVVEGDDKLKCGKNLLKSSDLPDRRLLRIIEVPGIFLLSLRHKILMHVLL
jgi:hypothetical protein